MEEKNVTITEIKPKWEEIPGQALDPAENIEMDILGGNEEQSKMKW